MAKAFSEEEKILIKERIMETALDLFHDKGTKSISISELTKRAGIAQGSFYSFWNDKESLIIDIMAYRSLQKLNALEKEFLHSLERPKEFLANIIYVYSIDLLEKIKTQSTYKEAFKIFANKGTADENRFAKLYRDFLIKLVDYWKENSAVKSADEEGLSNAFIGSFVLCVGYEHFSEQNFKEVLKLFIWGILDKYIEL